MVAPTSVGFLISDCRYGGYGIVQPQAKEKSFLGLPMLAATASTDVVISERTRFLVVFLLELLFLPLRESHLIIFP